MIEITKKLGVILLFFTILKRGQDDLHAADLANMNENTAIRYNVRQTLPQVTILNSGLHSA
jgi:hypothetical protein